MRELHLFAGCGGGILGGILLGHTCVCAVEIEPYCRKVLLQRQRDGILPRFPIWDDVRTFDGKPWQGKADVVCGGFPCQDISCAGLGGGIEGEQSGLWNEMRRIICEVGPRFAFVENSPTLTSRGLGIVLRDLAEMGMDARWCVLGADDVGAEHHRKRIWILAYPKRHEQSREESCCWTPRRVGWQRQSFPWNESPGIALSRLRGLDDRPSCVVDRTDSIRNAQVPAVVELAWKTLSQ